MVLGGDASEVGAWKREAERVGVANVVFTGFKENADVAKFMKCADILFMPHDLAEKRSVMDIETTSPIKLFDYMAAGKPIVTSDLPTISKVLTHGESGLLVSPQVPYDEPIRWLISNPRSAEQLGANAKAKARDFTYRKRAEKILSSPPPRARRRGGGIGGRESRDRGGRTKQARDRHTPGTPTGSNLEAATISRFAQLTGDAR